MHSEIDIEDKYYPYIEYGRIAHREQRRKYTGEPYFDGHCIPVAQLVRDYGGTDDMVCAALLHDVLEDTHTTPGGLSEFIFTVNRVGWLKNINPVNVLNYVLELTDEFTKERYPQLNRKLRKEYEAMRWGAASYEAQTIKCCDIIHNTTTIVEHDPGFAIIYLEEVHNKLRNMNKAKSQPYIAAMSIVQQHLAIYNKTSVSESV